MALLKRSPTCVAQSGPRCRIGMHVSFVRTHTGCSATAEYDFSWGRYRRAVVIERYLINIHNVMRRLGELDTAIQRIHPRWPAARPSHQKFISAQQV